MIAGQTRGSSGRQGGRQAVLPAAVGGLPVQPLATGLAAPAWIRQAEDDHAGALEAIGEADRVVATPGVASLLNPVPAQRARLLLAHGRPEQAGELLERLEGLAVAQQRAGSRIEIQALQALALAAAGEEASAVTALDQALTLARLIATQRTRRTQQTTAGGVPLSYLGRVVRAFGRATAATGPRRPAGTVVVAGLVEPLSDRELEVLHLLAAGKPNQQIAEELVVALNTVKKHVAHILDKLGTANRTEATARARELGLLR